jgi:GTP-binding protein EngB required for normal cell division
MTEKDMMMLRELENYEKDFIIIANKIDKMTQSEYHKKMKEIRQSAGKHEVIPFSTKKRNGIEKLIDEIFI